MQGSSGLALAGPPAKGVSEGLQMLLPWQGDAGSHLHADAAQQSPGHVQLLFPKS